MKLNAWADLYRVIQRDPFAFCQVLGLEGKSEITDYQAAVLRDVQQGHRRVAVKSGQGPGKTLITCVIALWRTIRAYKAMTVLSAPSVRQCRDVFLAETQRILDNADPLLRKFINVTKSRIIFGGTRDWEIKVATATKSANLSGYHQDHLTMIFDEAQGILREIFETAQGTLSNEDYMFVAIGNPTSKDSAFYDLFGKWRHLWRCHTFDCEHAAEKYPHIVSPERNFLLAEQYGKDSDVYRVRVKGEFPATDPNSIISSDDLEACARTSKVQCSLLNARDKSFGIDLAAFGPDESVVYRRAGNAVVEQAIFQSRDPSDVVAAAFRMQAACGWKDDVCVYVFDAGGMGAGVRHMFDSRRTCNYVAFHTQSPAANSMEYADRMTEAWFHFGRLARSRELHIPDDPVLIKQLSSRQYDLDPKGRLRVESKRRYMERTKEPSPDRADAIVMAFHSSVVGMGQVARRDPASRVSSGFGVPR